MDVLTENITGLDEANARLLELEKSDRGDQGEAQTTPEQRGDDGADRAGADKARDGQKTASDPTDTPAAPDKAADPKSQENQPSDPAKAAEKKAADEKAAAAERDTKGRYAKSQERLTKTWDEVNKRKTEIDTQSQQLTQRESALKQRESEFQRQQEQSQAQYKPEDYVKASDAKMERAKAFHLQADGIEARVKKAEEDGNFTEAARLTEQAKQYRKAAFKEEGNAEDLKAHADELRRNPPATSKQREEQTAAQKKEWTLKAATDFPELAQNGSELQKSVAGHLSELAQQDPVLSSHPQIIYHVTRLAAAETAAARVPALEKELGEAKAKVKELEVLTSPGGAGSVQRQPSGDGPKSEDQERAELGQMAEQAGAIPR